MKRSCINRTSAQNLQMCDGIFDFPYGFLNIRADITLTGKKLVGIHSLNLTATNTFPPIEIFNFFRIGVFGILAVLNERYRFRCQIFLDTCAKRDRGINRTELRLILILFGNMTFPRSNSRIYPLVFIINKKTKA